MAHLPAKSTKLMLDVLEDSIPVTGSRVLWVREMTTIVCARELVSFMFVEAMLRFVVPSSIRCAISFLDETTTDFNPSAVLIQSVSEER